MNRQPIRDEIDLREYFSVMRRRWKLIAIFAFGLMAAALIFSLMQEPVYEAETTILVNSGGGGSMSQLAGLAAMVGKSSPGGGVMNDLMVLLESRAVADRVAKELDLRNKIKGWANPSMTDQRIAENVQGMMQTPKFTGKLLTIKTRYSEPRLAAEIVDGYVDAVSFYWNRLNYTEAKQKREYIESQLPRVNQDLARIEEQIKEFSLLGVGQPTVKLKRLEREYEIQSNVYKMLRTEYETIKLDESKEFPPASVVDAAVVPKTPVSPKVKLNAFIGLVLGMCSGLFVAFFKEYWDGSNKRVGV
ncbi:GumC family protein [Candidatus Margulisiibacteriota bacterium]